MVRSFARPFIAALAAVATVTAAAQAQRGRPSVLEVDREADPSFGVRATYSADLPNALWGYGAQLRLPVGFGLAFEPNVDVWNRNGANIWQANADMLALDRRGMLYLRAGLAALKTPVVDVKYGLNLGIGADFDYLLQTPVRPFAEARWSFIDGNRPFRVLVGLNFAMGHR